MSHVHHGRVCHLNGCTKGQTVPVLCPACEQQVGRAPKAGMAQASVTWEKLNAHLPDCQGGAAVPIVTWYCTHPGERTFDPADGAPLPEPDRCVHPECKPTGPQVVLDADPVDERDVAELRRENDRLRAEANWLADQLAAKRGKATFNVCPKQQCRSRTDHSTLRHWTPVYLGEVGYIVKAHVTRTCGCRTNLLADLAAMTWSTLRYFACETKRWFGHRVLHRDW